MGVVCRASNVGSDVRCAVCGQGFLVYWTGKQPEQRALQQAEVLQSLRRHHACSGEDAHPAGEFQVMLEERVAA